MTQALYTSMSGLNAGTQQLTVVSDNIANMNTTAYKTSRVDFQDIWYQTKTTGTNSTAVMGGTNPYQVGVGVQCAGITKNMQPSTTNTTTGNPTDLAITGYGWFTVIDSDGNVSLTRDGTFHLDEEGYLCTATGDKVLGTDSLTSSTASTTPIKFPTMIKVVEEPTNAADFADTKISELNNAQTITPGEFKITVNKAGGGTQELTINLSPDDINNDTTVAQLVAEINNQSQGQFTASVVDGAIQFEPAAGGDTLAFESVPDGSNFVAQTKLAGIAPDENGNYTSHTMGISATISQVDDVTADTTKLYSSYSVGQDGRVTVTYSDGSTLTVLANEDGSTYFSYTTNEGVEINSDVNNSGEAPLLVDSNVLVKANMQIQLAKVTNDGGLVATGNNKYVVGVNSGDVIYTASGINGTGNIQAGALEASNVDLSEQFANMILAQRLVQANSQVFNGANSMLETLVYLGNG